MFKNSNLGNYMFEDNLCAKVIISCNGYNNN